MNEDAANSGRDLLDNPLTATLLFGGPLLALVVSGALGLGAALHTAIWGAALVVLSASCIVNAVRCRRIHCYFTGPFFLVMAVIVLLYGIGVIHLGARGWSTISLSLVIGALVLYWAPELLFGRYAKGSYFPR